MTKSRRPNYVIYAPDFDPDSGGAIFLHQLAHALGQLGEDASLWPWNVPSRSDTRKHLRRIIRNPGLLWQKPVGKLLCDPAMQTRIATHKDLRSDTIVVYPEVTLGNPLQARKIARWLLYKPGLKDPFQFTENEMFFRAGEMSDLPEMTGGAEDLFLWRRNPVYRDENRPERKGVCYMVRKGHEKERIPETEEPAAICIDGLSHEKAAEVFNTCQIFYSYDEATLYSQYAAICGCTSVIVPGFFRDRSEWVASHPLGRVGVAYGLDDLDHARQTRSQVQGVLDAQEEAGLDTVRRFISTTQAGFSVA